MLGERLYGLRRKQGLSQEQLAEKIGVSRQTISKWEGNLSTPDLDKLIVLADCFGVSLDELARHERTSQVSINAEPETSRERDQSGTKLQRFVGLGLCVLGLVCLVVTMVLLFLCPQAMDSIDGSIAVTISGSGFLYGICILAVIVGIYLIIRKD